MFGLGETLDYAEENALVLVNTWPENFFGLHDNLDYVNLDYVEFTVVVNSMGPEE